MRKEVTIKMYLTVDCEEDATAVECAEDLADRILADQDCLDDNWEAQFLNLDVGEITECDVIDIEEVCDKCRSNGPGHGCGCGN